MTEGEVVVEDEDARDALAGALETGDWDAARERLLAVPSDGDVTDSSGVSALLHACYRRDDEVRDAILAVRDPADAFEAAACGDAAVLAEALEADPAVLDATSPDGFTPLHLAAFLGHDELVAALVDAGADVDAVARNASRVRPLHSAVAGGNAAAVAALVDGGATVGVVQAGGFTPLMGAAQRGDREMVTTLLAAGADPASTADDGATAATLAADPVRDLLA